MIGSLRKIAKDGRGRRRKIKCAVDDVVSLRNRIRKGGMRSWFGVRGRNHRLGFARHSAQMGILWLTASFSGSREIALAGIIGSVW